MKKYFLTLSLLLGLNKAFATLPKVPDYVNPIQAINTSLNATFLGDYPTACTASTPTTQDCWLSVFVPKGKSFYGMLVYDAVTNKNEQRRYPYPRSNPPIHEFIMPCNFQASLNTSFKLYRSSLYNILFNSFQVQPWNPGSANINWITVGVLLKAINNSDLSTFGCPGATCLPPTDAVTMQIIRQQNTANVQMHVACSDSTMLCVVINNGNPVPQPPNGDPYYLENI